MNLKYRVDVTRFALLKSLDGAWSADDFAALLEGMDFGSTTGMSDADLKEMCLLSLQDLEPAEAAAIILQRHLGSRLNAGQVRNLSYEMEDEKMWEEYPDLSLHEAMFNVGSLLYSALPDHFPDPDAVRVSLQVTADSEAAAAVLRRPLHESFIVRLLADGMEDGSPLHRLFGDALKGSPFPEADKIVWTVQSEPSNEQSVAVDVVSSGYWLDALRETKSYTSTAFADSAEHRGKQAKV